MSGGEENAWLPLPTPELPFYILPLPTPLVTLLPIRPVFHRLDPFHVPGGTYCSLPSIYTPKSNFSLPDWNLVSLFLEQMDIRLQEIGLPRPTTPNNRKMND